MTEDEMIAAIRRLPVALAERDADAITDILGALIAARVRIGERWRGFAQVLLHQGEIDMAVQAYDLLAAQVVDRDEALFAKAAALADNERVEEAREIVAKLSARALQAGQRAHFLGVANSQLGRLNDARTLLRQALDEDEFSGPTWHSLTSIVDMAADRSLAERLISAAEGIKRRSDADRAAYCYAKGKLYADLNEHAQAFAAIEQGASLLARERVYHASADSAQVDAIIAETWPVIASNQEEGADPIFVLGFPRSGTTLVQQILARHPAIGGGGEANLFGTIAQQVGGRQAEPFGAWLSRQTEPLVAMNHLRARYVHLLDQRYPGGGRRVDKSLGNSRYLGLIATLLPNAAIVWLRRNPLDVAWSNLRTFFPVGMNWSLSQKGLAAHMANEDRLLAHWQSRLGTRLHVVSYEALVDNPARSTCEIYQHCGLDPEVETRRPLSAAISTASFAQARMPINKTAIGAADPYRRHLMPFIQAYRELGGLID